MPLRLSRQTAAQWGLKATGGNKFGAVKVNGFDSGHEAKVFLDLRLREMAGEIRELRSQPVFLLFANRQFVGKFTLDVCYRTLADELVVVDAKQPHTRTTAYMLRKRILKAIYGLDVQEIY